MKKIIPYRTNILCKRKKIGEKLGSGLLHAADETAERLTEIAEVVYMPDQTLADKALIDNAEAIINGITEQAKQGNSYALESLMKFKDYLCAQSIKVGDTIFIGKYVGTDFSVGETGELLTILNAEDIRGLVVEVNK